MGISEREMTISRANTAMEIGNDGYQMGNDSVI